MVVVVVIVVLVVVEVVVVVVVVMPSWFLANRSTPRCSASSWQSSCRPLDAARCKAVSPDEVVSVALAPLDSKNCTKRFSALW